MYKRISKSEAEKADQNTRHIHPNAVLADLITLMQDIGAKKFLHGAGYNKERDAFLACMFAYAIRGYTGSQPYIQQIDDPPDFALLIPTDRQTKEKPFDYARVEIVEAPLKIDQEQDKISYLKNLLVKSKLTNYFPDPGTMLLVFLNTVSAKVILLEIQKWYIENKDLFKRFGEVFTLHIDSITKEDAITYTVTSLSKDWGISQKIMEEYKRKTPQHPLIERYGVIVDESLKSN